MSDKFLNDILTVNASPKYIKNNTLPPAEEIASTAYLQFNTIQQAFLSFIAVEEISGTAATLSFKSIYSPIIDNDLVCLNFSWENPSLISSEVSIPVLSFLHSISIDFNNTGSLGNTSIGIYINDVLYDTYTISPTQTNYNYIEHFLSGTNLTTGDVVRVSLLDVADDSSDLKIGLYYKVFKDDIEVTKVVNIYQDIATQSSDGHTVFSTADTWGIDLNQPIDSIISAEAYYNGVSVGELDTTLTFGDIYNNRVSIEPIATRMSEVILKVKAFNDKEYTLSVYINWSPTLLSLAYYQSDVTPIPYVTFFIYCIRFRYKLNSGAYSSWTDVADSYYPVDLSTSSDGVNTITLQYQTLNGIIYDTLTYNYSTGDIDATFELFDRGAEITYTDTTPINKAVYSINGVTKREEYPCVANGFGSFIVDTDNHTIQIPTGTIQYKGNLFTYTPVSQPFVADRNFYMFVFDKDNLQFKYIEAANNGEGESTGIDSLRYIKIRQIALAYDTTINEDPLATIIIYKEEDLIEPYLFEWSVATTGYHTITVYDIAGRSISDYVAYLKQQNTTSKTVTATNDLLEDVKSGQIHFSDNLTFTISED